VILRVNNQPIANSDSFREALLTARRGRSVLLLVRRGRYGYHITLPFQAQRL
jgi:S1-C subfamily serine protease